VFRWGGKEVENSKKKTQFIVMAMVVLIVLTRALTISHNMELHADEYVFYTAAQSLKGYLSGSSPIYEEVKEYPEGAIVMQLPFHIMTAVINRLFNCSITPRLSGRIAAVFYFTAGAVLGCLVLNRFFTQKRLHLALYGIIMVFSLWHIQQSRYGTADAITLFLLMAVILFAGQSLVSPASCRWLFAAFFASGMLGACKYPLFFFAIIPVYAAVIISGKLSPGKKLLVIGASFVFLYLGFAVISPKAALDPLYIWRASTREVDSYMSSNGDSLISTVWSHFMSVTTYSMLYSGFPFAPVFFIIGVKNLRNSSEDVTPAHTLFSRVIPSVIVAFFAYNLFVSLLFFRTYYPFFFLTDLYVVMAIGRWIEDGRAKKAMAVLLTAVMIIRGAYFIYLLSDKDDKIHMAQLISETVDDEWKATTIISGFLVLPDDYTEYPNLKVINITDERLVNPQSNGLEKGELLIAGASYYTDEYLYCDFLPSNYNDYGSTLVWNNFAETNAQYYVGELYPNYIYYLFGYWMAGCDFNAEFPAFHVYYRG
jgi:hypothetical protein